MTKQLRYPALGGSLYYLLEHPILNYLEEFYDRRGAVMEAVGKIASVNVNNLSADELMEFDWDSVEIDMTALGDIARGAAFDMAKIEKMRDAGWAELVRLQRDYVGVEGE